MVDKIYHEFENETVICIASGPSVTQQQVKVVQNTGHPVIVVNNSFKLAPWADILFATDVLWWYKYYNEVADEFSGDLWTIDGVGDHFVKKTGKTNPPIKQVAYDRELGLGKVRVNHGGNSGYIAINLAYLMGAKKIVLIGYDHQHTDGKTHWHGDHDRKHFRQNAGDTDRWLSNLNWLLYDLKREGIDVVNCSLQTAIETCRRGTLEDEI